VYINFWYPVCASSDLAPGSAVPARILALPFAAYRDPGGTAHVLADTCVHRGGSLGRGRVLGDRLACPYHGWQYDGSGRCVHIPSLGERGNVPARAKVDSYPVIERYGIVFAFLGDLPEDERCPFPEIREWGESGWRASRLMTMELDAYFERSMENGLDPAHNEFVHELQGNIRLLPDSVRTEPDEWGSTIFARTTTPQPGKTQLDNLRNDRKPEKFGASSRHHGPNSLATRIDLSETNSFVQYFFEQPVDERHTRIFFVNMRNCMLGPEHDERIERINLAVAGEDIAIVGTLRPLRTPRSSTKEVLVAGDEGIGPYRAHLRRWQARGWRIDVRALRDGEGDVAHAIPSPGRRTSANWVLDPVPMLPGDGQVLTPGRK
jgi:phenylpropionate dioxygenase-like ring-hydroxylating dioxygenase large terminal subunit